MYYNNLVVYEHFLFQNFPPTKQVKDDFLDFQELRFQLNQTNLSDLSNRLIIIRTQY